MYLYIGLFEYLNRALLILQKSPMYKYICRDMYLYSPIYIHTLYLYERWGAGVETQKNVRGEIGGWGRVPFNETYAPSLSTIYDGA